MSASMVLQMVTGDIDDDIGPAGSRPFFTYIFPAASQRAQEEGVLRRTVHERERFGSALPAILLKPRE